MVILHAAFIKPQSNVLGPLVTDLYSTETLKGNIRNIIELTVFAVYVLIRRETEAYMKY
jgi:hypothetical protein